MEDEPQSFSEAIRRLSREVSEAAERLSSLDPDELVRSVGLDPESVRGWVDEAGRWIRERGEWPGSFSAARGFGPPREATPDPFAGSDRSAAEASPRDPWRQAAPHPLDMPTAEQGAALAALDSGRWTIEPGTEMLTGRAEGPGPSDALGLVRELRVRDWTAADGALTAAGRRALERWLDAASRD